MGRLRNRGKRRRRSAPGANMVSICHERLGSYQLTLKFHHQKWCARVGSSSGHRLSPALATRSSIKSPYKMSWELG